MPVYTRRGDKGQTDLFSGERVSKTDPLIEAYGTVDELNALLGVVRSAPGSLSEDQDELLTTLQNHLHTVCANLANTRDDEDKPRITSVQIDFLEEQCDWHEEQLQRLQQFILPGGVYRASLLHHARTVCRRAERRVITAGESKTVDELVIAFLNRLSDLLFLMARYVNHVAGQKERTVKYVR